MNGELHINLIVEGAPPGSTEPVEARDLGDGTYEIPWTPGFVEGNAAGDIIRMIDPSLGTFEVVERGGNLAVKLFSAGPIAEVLDAIKDRIAKLGGRVDGSIEKAAALTFPLKAGFTEIEELFGRTVTDFPGSEWYYSNVHDDRGEPLNWWLEPRSSARADLVLLALHAASAALFVLSVYFESALGWLLLPLVWTVLVAAIAFDKAPGMVPSRWAKVGSLSLLVVVWIVIILSLAGFYYTFSPA